MLSKKRSGMLFLNILYQCLLLAVIIGLMIGSYLYSYQTFTNEAYDVNDTTKQVVMIKKNDTEKDVANKLKKQHLIVSAYRFRARKILSKYKNLAFVPGSYELSPSQGIDDIIGILVGESDGKVTR